MQRNNFAEEFARKTRPQKKKLAQEENSIIEVRQDPKNTCEICVKTQLKVIKRHLSVFFASSQG